MLVEASSPTVHEVAFPEASPATEVVLAVAHQPGATTVPLADHHGAVLLLAVAPLAGEAVVAGRLVGEEETAAVHQAGGAEEEMVAAQRMAVERLLMAEQPPMVATTTVGALRMAADSALEVARQLGAALAVLHRSREDCRLLHQAHTMHQRLVLMLRQLPAVMAHTRHLRLVAHLWTHLRLVTTLRLLLVTSTELLLQRHLRQVDGTLQRLRQAAMIRGMIRLSLCISITFICSIAGVSKPVIRQLSSFEGTES